VIDKLTFLLSLQEPIRTCQSDVSSNCRFPRPRSFFIDVLINY